MSKGLEALERLCKKCRAAINQIPSEGDRFFKECPWRGISGDYCDDYEIVKAALERK